MSAVLSFSLSLSLSFAQLVVPVINTSFTSLLTFLPLEQYQKRRATVVIAQNLAQPAVTVQQPTPVIQVQQGFVQPQPTYVAPNQFPNNNHNDFN